MSGRTNFLLSVLFVLALCGQTHAGGIRAPRPVPSKAETVSTVPFDLYQGYLMVVHGTAGNLKNLNFLLDTGTTLPVIDSQTARKLNLRGQAPASVVIVGGSAQGEEANLASLEIGPVRQTNLPIFTTDLSFFRKALPVRIDAIVGLNVLGQTPFVIDYSSHVIRFGPLPALQVSVPLRLESGLAVFDAEIDHSLVHLLLDTGAPSLILFNSVPPEGAHEVAAADHQPQAIGDFNSKQVRLRSLKLGAEEFRREPALLALNPEPSQFHFDGLMSPASLGISQLSIDLRAGVLSFSR